MLSGGADNISLFRVVHENELNSYLEKKSKKAFQQIKNFNPTRDARGKGPKRHLSDFPL